MSERRDTAALVDLATYINLLSLRAGSPLHTTASEDIDLDEDDSFPEPESSTITARQDELSRSYGKLRERFLDRLAGLFAAERNGQFVTATVFKEVEREACVDIYLARNNGFKRVRDHEVSSWLTDEEMVEVVERTLNQLAQGGCQDGKNTQFWDSMLRYASCRLKTYHEILMKVLTPHKVLLQSMIHDPATPTADNVRRIWKDVYTYVFDVPSHMTKLQALDGLVRTGAAVRKAIRTGTDISTPFDRPTWASKAITTLCMAGKVSSLYDTSIRTATTIWQGYTFNLVPLWQATAPAPLPRRSFNVATALEHIQLPAADPVANVYTGKRDAEKKFTAVQKERTCVHAEIQLLFHLAHNRITDVYPYIGSSKLPCVLCAAFINAEGTFTCRKSHEHLYTKWMIPDMKNLPEDVGLHMLTAVNKMSQTLRTHLLSPPAKGRDFRPESTVDVTISNVTAETSQVPLSAKAIVALEQRRITEEQGNISRMLSLRLREASEDELSVDNSIDDEILTLRHPEHDGNAAEYECGGCPRLTSRRCSRCGKDRFCSTFCEIRMTAIHKFRCTNGALTTADYLVCDCAANEIPNDPDVLADFGFTNLSTFPDRSKLLGLYKGLDYLEVTAAKLHDWRTAGVLVDRIIETFETLPSSSRGGYFPWFVENRHRIFPSVPLPNPEVDAFAQFYDAAKFVLQPEDRARLIHKLQPESKRKAFIFAALLRQMMHPGPDLASPYWDFGFGACRDEDEEAVLGKLYQELVVGDARSLHRLYWGDTSAAPDGAALFSDFWQAFDSGTLVQLMDRKGLKSERVKIRHLENYLNGPEFAQSLPVWELLTFLKSTEQEPPTMEVFVDFKFILCNNPLERSYLKGLYASVLARCDIVELQQAQSTGRLLEFIQSHVEIDQNMVQLFAREATTNRTSSSRNRG